MAEFRPGRRSRALHIASLRAMFPGVPSGGLRAGMAGEEVAQPGGEGRERKREREREEKRKHAREEEKKKKKKKKEPA